jgi:hypothetical protein
MVAWPARSKRDASMLRLLDEARKTNQFFEK